MTTRSVAALLVAAMMYIPFCARAYEQPAVVQSEPDTVWVREYNSDAITDVAFSPDGSLVATVGQDQKINVINTANGTLLQTIHTPSRQYRVVFGTHGEGLYSCGIGAKVHLWNTTTGEETKAYAIAGHNIVDTTTLGINDMSLSKNGRYLATCAFYDVIVTDLQAGAQIQKFVPEGQGLRGSSVSINADANRMAVGSDLGRVFMVDVQSGKAIDSVRPAGSAKGGVKYSPDGRFVAAGSLSKEGTGSAFLFDAETLERKQQWDIQGSVEDIAFSPGGRYITVASNDGHIYIWDVDSGKLVRTYSYTDLFGIEVEQRCVAVSPDSTRLASGLADYRTYLWNANWSPATSVEEQPSTITSTTVAIDDTDQQLHIHFAFTATTTVQIEIVDIQGRVLAQSNSSYTAGEHNTTMLTSTLARGAYFCRVQADGHTAIQPFTIQR